MAFLGVDRQSNSRPQTRLSRSAVNCSILCQLIKSSDSNVLSECLGCPKGESVVARQARISASATHEWSVRRKGNQYETNKHDETESAIVVPQGFLSGTFISQLQLTFVEYLRIDKLTHKNKGGVECLATTGRSLRPRLLSD
jgi:hypothetical protein